MTSKARCVAHYTARVTEQTAQRRAQRYAQHRVGVFVTVDVLTKAFDL